MPSTPLQHLPLPQCTATPIGRTDEFPIGKMRITYRDAYNSNHQQSQPVYYFKGYNNKPIKKGSKLDNTFLTRLLIPKEFRFLRISLTDGLEGLQIDGPQVKGVELEEGKLVEEYEERDIDGLFAFGYNYVYHILQIKHLAKKNPQVKKIYLRAQKFYEKQSTSRYMTAYAAPMLDADLRNPFNNFPGIDLGDIGGGFDELPPEKDIGVRGYIGSGSCPFGLVGSAHPLSEIGSSSSGNRSNGDWWKNSTIFSLFFKYQNHYFLPLTLSNGNTFYYAFENPEILKFWGYRYVKSNNSPFDIAGNGPIYYENILGISICKTVDLVRAGHPTREFWK